MSSIKFNRDNCLDAMRMEQDPKTSRGSLLVAIRAPLHGNSQPAGCNQPLGGDKTVKTVSAKISFFPIPWGFSYTGI